MMQLQVRRFGSDREDLRRSNVSSLDRRSMSTKGRRVSFLLLSWGLSWAVGASASSASPKPFVARAQETHSAVVLLMRDGKQVTEYHDKTLEPSAIDLRSATRSVIALGIGLLLRDGFIDSLDAPVYRFFPEWNQGRKKQITIRMLLNQTSGLRNAADPASPDVVRYALAAELHADPGESFSESDSAANLLTALIAKASGKSADEYFADKLFAPLRISEVTWQKDASGNVLGSTGLALRAQDALSLGQLVLEGGAWKGQQIVPEDYINEMLNPPATKNVEYGLLWARTPAWIRLRVDDSSLDLVRNMGVTEHVVEQIAKLQGHTFDSSESLVSGLHKVLSDEEFDALYSAAQARAIRMGTIFHLELGPMAAFSASGEGQYIVVIPAAKVVAVRQSLSADDQYEDFPDRVLDVARSWSSALKP
jgi:CubicO group peptidase (beta-lactamase class C family)